MLRDAHAHLHIDDEAFDEMIGLFKRTLKDFAIADADVETIIADLNAHRPQIVRPREKLRPGPSYSSGRSRSSSRTVRGDRRAAMRRP